MAHSAPETNFAKAYACLEIAFNRRRVDAWPELVASDHWRGGKRDGTIPWGTRIVLPRCEAEDLLFVVRLARINGDQTAART